MTKGLDTSERALKVRSLLESYYSAQEEDAEQEHRHRSVGCISCSVAGMCRVDDVRWGKDVA